MKQVVYNAATKTQTLENVDSNVVKSQREQLIQAFRVKKENDNGKKNRLPKEYLNTELWIQITDPYVFKDIFPNYLHFIADEIDEWYIFVKRTYKQLINSKELNERKDEMLKSISPDKIKDILFESNHRKDDLQNMNYFELYDLFVKYGAIKKQTVKKE